MLFRSNYRNPKKKQVTNKRINAVFKEHFRNGGKIEVDVIKNDISIFIEEQIHPVDLRDKATRRFLENGLLLCDISENFSLLNL